MLILGAVLLVPVNKVDVAQLRPIEVISIYKEGSTVVLETDTEDIGRGADVLAALQDMKQTSPAVIYLDTAEYLLIAENAVKEAEQLRGVLKEAVQLCMAQERINLQEAAKYLPVHGEFPKLRQWKAGDQLPVIGLENDRIKIS